MSEGLQACQVMLLLVSPAAMVSKKVQEQVSVFQHLQKPIIPILHRLTSVNEQWIRTSYIDFINQNFEVAFASLYVTISLYIKHGLKPLVMPNGLEGELDGNSLLTDIPIAAPEETFSDADSREYRRYSGEDILFPQAVELVRTLNAASTTLLQRYFRIGYKRASRIILLMERRKIIGPAKGSNKQRDVIG